VLQRRSVGGADCTPSTATGHVRAFRQNLAVRAYSVAQGSIRLIARQVFLYSDNKKIYLDFLSKKNLLKFKYI